MNNEPNFENILVDEIKPQGAMMLIEPLGFTGEQKTKSGIVIVNQHESATPSIGRILASGVMAKYKVGDMVFFRRYSLDEIEVKMKDGRKKMNFISEEDVIAQYQPNG